jgi:regulator of replication initiation timing
MSQVGVAYYTTEDLKSENETLRKENAELRKQLGHVSAAHDDETQTWAKKEAKLRRKAERRAEAVKEVREMTREIFELQHSSLPASKLQRNSTTRGRRPSDARITGPGLEELRQRSRSGSRRRSFQPEVKHQDKKVVVESYVHSEDGDSSVDETIQSQRSRKSSFNQKSITGAESSFESVFPVSLHISTR